jgi:hypothetical protein
MVAILDVGSTQNDETFYITSHKSFWQSYGSTDLMVSVVYFVHTYDNFISMAAMFD